MKTRKKTASAARNLKVAADAKTAKAVSVDAGLKAAANAATTTNAKSADVSVDAGAPKATVVELVTTKSADEVVIAKKAVAARASTAKRS